MNDQKSGSGAGQLFNKVEDAVAGAVGLASAAVGGHSEKMFVESARISDLYETRAAEIALERSRSPQVRAYAEQMLSDHRNSIQQMEKALIGSDLNAPAELDSRRRGMIDHLEQANDQSFDQTYLMQQKAAHHEALTLYEGFASSAQGTALAAFAAGGVPVLRQHKDRLEEIEANAGAAESS